VGDRVVAVGELVEHQATAFGLQLLGQVAGAFHALFLGHQDQLGAVGGHGRLAFGGGVVRHDQDHLVTLDRRRHGQGDAGVAGGRFDQGIAGLDLPAQLGASDHRQRRAVLDRAGRVVPFELEQRVLLVSPRCAAGEPAACCRRNRRWLGTARSWRIRNPDGRGAYHTGKPFAAISRNLWCYSYKL
jgi:hypothetical protein